MGRAAGPMTRTVADAALMMQVLAQPDARDSMSLPAQDIAWSSFDVGSRTSCAACASACCWMPAAAWRSSPRSSAAVEHAARLFEQAGAIVEPMQPFMTQAMLDGMDHFWRMRSLTRHECAAARRSAPRCCPTSAQWADSAAGFSGEHVFRAFSQFHATRVAAVAACAQFDYVISPSAPNMPALPPKPPSPTNDPLRPLEHIGFTVPYNMSEQPAASINCGYTAAGLPIGLQIAGQRFDDLGRAAGRARLRADSRRAAALARTTHGLREGQVDPAWASLAWSYTGCAGMSARCCVSAQLMMSIASPSMRTRFNPPLGISLWRGPPSGRARAVR